MLKIQPEGFTGIKEDFGATTWDDAYEAQKEDRILQGKVVGVERDPSTKEELVVVKYEHYRCFITKGDLGKHPKNLVGMVGSDVVFKIKLIDRSNNRIFLDRKSAVKEMSEVTWTHLEEAERTLKSTQDEIAAINTQIRAIRGGEVVAAPDTLKELTHKRNDLFDKTREIGVTATCTVKWTTAEAAFVDIGGIVAYLSRYEVNHSLVEDVRDYLHAGQSFDVKVIWVDKEDGIVKVSLRAMLPDPWKKAKETYQVGAVYYGVVKHITPYGPKIELEPAIMVSTNPPAFERDKVAIGDEVTVRITAFTGRTIRGYITKNLSRR